MKSLVPPLAAFGLACSSVAAQADESKLRQTSTLSVDALWKRVGDFCGISKWHPAVEKCELRNDGRTRTLPPKGRRDYRRAPCEVGSSSSFLYLYDCQQPAPGLA